MLISRILKCLFILSSLFVIYFLVHGKVGKEVKNSSHFFVVNVVTEIGNSWSVEKFERYSDRVPQMHQYITMAFVSYRALGFLKKAPVCDMKDFEVKEPTQYLSVTYECYAEFEKGPATIKIIIYHPRDRIEWKIEYFHLTSPYFIPNS